MKSRLYTTLASLFLLPLATAAGQQPPPPDQPPVPISSFVTISPADLASIALEKPLAVAPGLRITHMGVGRFDIPADISADEEKPPRIFVPSTEFPRVAGNSFGWVIRFDTNLDTILLTEEFVLPSPITISTSAGSTIVSEDGKTATTPREFNYLWDWTYNFWGFDPGDPVGDHEFAVFLDETELARMKFKVTEP